VKRSTVIVPLSSGAWPELLSTWEASVLLSTGTGVEFPKNDTGWRRRSPPAPFRRLGWGPRCRLRAQIGASPIRRHR